MGDDRTHAHASLDAESREILSTRRKELLKLWEHVLEYRLASVDEQLPMPLLFGRRRCRKIRDAAQHILHKEYAAGWIALLNARTRDELYDALLEGRDKARGPREAAKAAIDAAWRSL